MNAVQLQQAVRDYAESIGIDKIGFTTAAPFRELKNRLKRQQELGYQSGFEEKDLDKRTEPALLLDQAESIIAIAVAYPSKMADSPRGKKGERRGIFCRASWGTDYHTVLREKLGLLEEFILEHAPAAKVRSMVDTGELADRAVAERAGIGWSAKNCSIITPEFGSYVYLGEMITNIPFAPDVPMEDECGDCTLCLDVCPTGALIQGGQLNAQRCIAFLTQSKSQSQKNSVRSLGTVYTGAILAKRFVLKIKESTIYISKVFQPDPELAKPLFQPVLNLSNREFKEKFGHVSGSWRGKNPIQRNAIIALAHFKDESSVPELMIMLKNDQRHHAWAITWAVGQIGIEEGYEAIKEAFSKEEDSEVRTELEKAMDIQ